MDFWQAALLIFIGVFGFIGTMIFVVYVNDKM